MTITAKTSILSLCIILLSSVNSLAEIIPDTGITQCYKNSVTAYPCPSSSYYGQDGDYTINPPSYTKLDSHGVDLAMGAAEWAMVRDNITGLIWEVKQGYNDYTADYFNLHDGDNTYTWCDSNPDTNGGNSGTCGNGSDTETFLNALNDENYGGFSDWRLPTREELRSIKDYARYQFSLAINMGYFPNTVSSTKGYWSSTSVGTTDSALGDNFSINFDGGGGYKSDFLHVRAVRGGNPGAGAYIDNGDGTVTDTATGLMWQQTPAPNTMDWQNALSYSNNLNLGGYTDWRLPNLKELASLADLNRPKPAINTDYFTLVVPGFSSYDYWSSSTAIASSTANAWRMNLYHGYGWNYYKTKNALVRAVRGAIISSTDPAVGSYKGGTPVSINGSGFGNYKGNGVVYFGDLILPISSWSDNEIICTTTASIGGHVNVKVITNQQLKVVAPQAFFFSPDQDGDGYLSIDDCDDSAQGIHTVLFGYGDDDGDGFHAGWTTQLCTSGELPPGYLLSQPDEMDFDDNNPDIYPGAPELCDFKDNNQDGRVDESLFCGHPPFVTPDTGQTICYDDTGGTFYPCPLDGEEFYGQDGSSIINPPVYDKLGYNGAGLPFDSNSDADWIMTRDNITGLIWEIKKSDQGSIHNTSDTYTWCETDLDGVESGTCGDGTDTEDFISALNTERFGGFSDWRLPSRVELHSIQDYGKLSPAIDSEYFPNIQSNAYWSTTQCSTFDTPQGCAMPVYFHTGGDGNYGTNAPLYVMAVRGPQMKEPSNRLINNGDGTITDAQSGLMWQQSKAPGSYNWKEGLNYAENLVLAGYDDWRLPNIKELVSIVSDDRSPRIDTSFFPATDFDPLAEKNNFWSSTSWLYSAQYVNAWYVEFGGGRVNSDLGNKQANYNVRAVRTGQTAFPGDFNSDGDVDGQDLASFSSLTGTSSISVDQFAAWYGTQNSSDSDGDGFVFGVDLDDSDHTVFPNAPEICDGLDNDQDGILPDMEIDSDFDGYVDCIIDSGGWNGNPTVIGGNDIDDTDSDIYSVHPEICDGLDNNQDSIFPASEIDNDADGYVECTIDLGGWNGNPAILGGDDSDDTNSNIYPGAPEICDGLDNDQNGVVPDTEIDSDSDGYVECTIAGGAWKGSQAVIGGNDSDDNDPDTHLAALEVCDGLDNDRDGILPISEIDNDSDGYVECTIDTGGWKGNQDVQGGSDSDDTNSNTYPGAPEICDGLDNNQDNIWPGGEIDNDFDHYVECTIDSGGWYGSSAVMGGNDIADSDSSIYPNAPEICDGLDNNQDGVLPDEEIDNDLDGYVECTIDSGGWDGDSTVIGGDDSNDDDATISPNELELCDGLDNNQDGVLPAEEIDNDSDSFVECTIDSGGWYGDSSVLGGDDYNDNNSGVYPDAPELCDGLDNNQDGILPDIEIDNDSDHYVECTIDYDTGGWNGDAAVLGGNDNDDTNPGICPHAPELCDGVDNDQNGLTDEHPTCPKILSFSDNFDDNQFSPVMWNGEIETDGNITETNGTLLISQPQSGVAGLVAANLNCLFVGDFDATVDFNLLDWPAEAHAPTIQLVAHDNENSRSMYIERLEYWDPPQIKPFYHSSVATGLVNTSELSGKFKLVRKGSVLSAYYYDGNHFIEIGSGTGSDGPVSFALNLVSSAVTPGGKVAFDNFKVISENSYCAGPVAEQYSYGISSFSINGNLPGSVVDNFDDGVLWEGIDGTASEENGVVRIKDPGKTDMELTDKYFIASQESMIHTGNSSFQISDGGGDFVAQSRWLQAGPALNHNILMSLYLRDGSGAEIENFVVGIFNIGPLLADAYGLPEGMRVFYYYEDNLSGASQMQDTAIVTQDIIGDVIFEIHFNDATDQISVKYSLDGGHTAVKSIGGPLDSKMMDANSVNWTLGATVEDIKIR